VSKPLAGLKVLDLSRVLAGPWCSQLLADLGASVIKVERPELGDDTRHWGPPYIGESNQAAYFASCNRGKKSVCIDLASAEGQAQCKRLAAEADVLLENYKAGQLSKYGLDYAALKVLNPKLVYCSITGFGQDGPRRDEPGYDYVIQGLCGLMSVTGEHESVPDSQPQKVGVAVTDLATGLYASVAILSALRQRDREGVGSYIDMALLDVGVAITANQGMNYLASGRVPTRAGNAHANLAPYQVFACADGHFILAAGNDAQFRGVCAVLGLLELAEDERFATNPARVQHRDALTAQLQAPLLQKPRAFWIEAFTAAKVPCGPINTLENTFADAQVTHRQMQRSLVHASLGEMPQVRSPIVMDGLAQVSTHAPPLLGEHQALLTEEFPWASFDT
jgi:crotonobetainyl-CoA:carnitine CoA-transferase CaiB-like acyl-CoA transferase